MNLSIALMILLILVYGADTRDSIHGMGLYFSGPKE